MTLIHDAVSSHAQRNPGAVAVVFKDEVLAYGALHQQTNQLARALVEAGCKKGDRVGLLLPKSISAIVGMVGALKASCIYVPMDKASPAARLAKILDCAEPSCILAVESTAKLLAATLSARQRNGETRVGWLDTAAAERPGVFSQRDLLAFSAEPLDCDTEPQDNAHILFTSGSTGTPKGVAITHENVSSFVAWATRYFEMNSSDRVSCHAPLHFDLSSFDIWGAFRNGAQLHLMPQEVGMLPNTMVDFIRRNEITQWCSVPSALSYMAQFDAISDYDFPSLKRILWCGEVLPMHTLRYWMKRLPAVQFTNLYGPTEATVASSFFSVPRCPMEDEKEVPIGTACEGENLFVLDEHLSAAPAGVVGEIYIGGVGLSPGYWGDREKTDSVFVEHPQYGRIYKTGDLAKLDEDGLIYFLGRIDSQIKSRGYRIELGEIESALHGLSLLSECAVIAHETDSFEGTAICCAYVLRAHANGSVSDLRRALAELIPPYMLPSQWMECQSLPLNQNGKIDRPAVKALFASKRLRESLPKAHREPRSHKPLDPGSVCFTSDARTREEESKPIGRSAAACD